MKTETKEKVLSASKNILFILGSLGFVVIAASMGNAVQLLKYTPLIKKSKLQVFEINQAIKRLMTRGLLEIGEDKNYRYLMLTEKGKRLLLKYQIEGLTQNKPKKWDKKYRVIIFDVSEQLKRKRDQLRRSLQSFGFRCLQDSVWVYPYQCEDIITLLKQYLGFKGEVLYMVVEYIENDKFLKEEFGL
jgi:DNA-binding transcriptional regulator PaaX